MMFVCVVDVLKHSFVAMLEPFFQSLRKEGKGEGGGGKIHCQMVIIFVALATITMVAGFFLLSLQEVHSFA